jgi:small GTP-binding protein
MNVSKKVALLGHYGVGKSSLVRQFVYHKFSEEYRTTIGVNIEKKIVELPAATVSMIVWDIAGESSQTKVPDSYKLGSHGIIYVFDLTRPDTFHRLEDDVANLRNKLFNVPILVVGNKKDQLTEKVQQEIVNSLPLSPHALCSAKTGENVEALFTELAKKMI